MVPVHYFNQGAKTCQAQFPSRREFVESLVHSLHSVWMLE